MSKMFFPTLYKKKNSCPMDYLSEMSENTLFGQIGQIGRIL